MKICKQCEKEFEATGNNQIYCSKECKKIFVNQPQECSICGKFKIPKSGMTNGYSICGVCWIEKRKEICSKCGNNRPVCLRDVNRKAICSHCRGAMNKEICSECGILKLVDIRINNKPICNYCNAKKRKEICSICNKLKIVNSRDKNNKPICRLCKSKINKEMCSICNKLKIVNSRSNDKKPICVNCYANDNKLICFQCGLLKRVATRNNDGKPICNYCLSKNNSQLCYICNQIKIINNHINNHKICGNCSKLYIKFDKNLDLIKKYKKSKKILHHFVFEYYYKEYIKEYSVSRLIFENILNYNDNTLLRYDYYSKERNLLVELNEPCHYSWENYHKRFPNQTIDNFNKYCKNFETKVKLAKENNIELLIIDVKYKMKWNELRKLYDEHVYASPLP